MAKKFFRIVLILFLCLGFKPSEAKLFGVQNFTLSNGLEVYVIPNHKAPIAKHMLWFKVGSADEKEGKGGSAHLLEHLMFRGTKKVSGKEFEKILQENGVDSNAFTSRDYTAYHHSLDVSKLELVMALEADRFENLKISDEDFATEQKIVYQERKQVVENNPLSPFSETYQNLIWQEHPYHRPVSGTSAEILSLTKQDVEDLCQQYYTPKNAILVISGDVDTDTIKKLASKYYGKIKKSQLNSATKFPIVKNNQKAELNMQLPQVNSARYIRTYIAPSYNQAPQDIYALILFSKYLGEGETSVLYQELVLNKKLALDISSSYDYANRSYATFSISFIPAEGVSVSEIIQELDKTIYKAIEGLNIDKINNSKDKIIASLVYLKDNPFETAEIFGILKTIGMPLTEIEDYAKNIQSVTYTQVQETALKLIKNASQYSGTISPKEQNNNV